MSLAAAIGAAFCGTLCVATALRGKSDLTNHGYAAAVSSLILGVKSESFESITHSSLEMSGSPPF